jgi:nucleoid-associated protein
LVTEIIALAIHDLNRSDAGYSVALSKKLLDVTDTTLRVISTVYELYNSRTSKSHGRFTTAEGSPTEGQIRAYVEAKEKDFLGLTGKMMDNLAREAGKKSASVGGHVFFAHFRRDGSDFMLVTVVTDKLSAALTKNHGMEDVEHLDLDGFRFAGRINLTAWADKQDRYLSFLKGKGSISDYFRDFLGCDSAVLERKDTQSLVDALKEFTLTEKMVDTEATAFLSDALDYLGKANKAKEPVDFEAMANRLMPKEPGRLSKFLANTDRQLNEGYVPNASALKALVKVTAKTKMWSVEFTREAIDQSKVVFDKDKKSLTLMDVPDELINQMRAEGMISD